MISPKRRHLSSLRLYQPDKLAPELSCLLPRLREAARETCENVKGDGVEEEQKKSQKNSLWEMIVVVVQALLLAMVIRTLIIQPFTIPSGSMMPTLLIGDYIIVNKFAYGYSKYSLPFFAPDWFEGRFLASEPKRGDVVVFRFPPDPQVDYIKRVVGLPGDKIRVEDSILLINGTPVPRVPHGTFSSDHRMEAASVPVYQESLDKTVKYDTLDEALSIGDNTEEFSVPAGHYFMMGDNRDNSADSRFDVGFVPSENLVGRASFIMFSLGNQVSFLDVWKWPSSLRYDRFFKGIQ